MTDDVMKRHDGEDDDAYVVRLKRETGAKAAQRMQEVLHDDKAWGKDGWLTQPAQVKFIDAAMNRSYGVPERAAPDVSPLADVLSAAAIVRELYDSMQHLLPERRGAMPASDAVQQGEIIDVTPVAGAQEALERMKQIAGTTKAAVPRQPLTGARKRPTRRRQQAAG